MASSKLRTDASSSGDLPPDALFEILLRVPAKDLCRLRAVCLAWRALLTSDPLFVAAHKSRHTTPLLTLAYHDHDNNVAGVDIMDLSGDMLRRIPIVQGSFPVVGDSGDVCGHIPSSGLRMRVLPTHLDLICLYSDLYFDLWVLNPATGAFLALPTACHSEELRHELELEAGGLSVVDSYAVGKVSSSGQYKALRISRVGETLRQICEVNTLDDATNHGGWRGKQAPPFHIASSRDMKCAVVDEVVYFLMEILYSVPVEPVSIAAFNLETEEWMVTLHGPAALLTFIQESPYYGRLPHLFLYRNLSLAELNGCLVTIHNIECISTDLWFLTDFERGIWEKKYSMPPQIAKLDVGLYPFLVLDDWVILYSGCEGKFVREKSFLQKYDRRTGIYSDMLKLREPGFIAAYSGSPLSL